MSKEIVVPGELVSEHLKQLGEHVYAYEDRVYSDVLGIKNEHEDRVSVVPLRGRYLPMENDVVIGIVKNEKFAGYDVDINAFYTSFVSKQELREPLKIGSVVSAKVVKVNEVNEAELGMVKGLPHDGDVVSVIPVKVPRIIGKNSSMLNVIKNGTGSTIMVGRNGLIFVHGGELQLAKDALLRVEQFAHVEHLTSDLQKFLAVKTGMGMPHTNGPMNEAAFEVAGGGGFRGGRGGFRGGGDRRGGGFRGGGDRRGGGSRFGNRGDDRGPRGGDRGFSRGPSRFGSNPRGNFRGGDRNNDRRDGGGFRPRRGFGDQYGGNRNEENRAPRFQPRKRFGRDDRVRGDEDPTFE